MYCIVYCIVLYCVLYCIVLYCILLYCVLYRVLHHLVLHKFVYIILFLSFTHPFSSTHFYLQLLISYSLSSNLLYLKVKEGDYFAAGGWSGKIKRISHENGNNRADNRNFEKGRVPLGETGWGVNI